MKIIIYNYDLRRAIINFFEIYDLLEENFENTIESLPRSIGSNENFEHLYDGEFDSTINKYKKLGFYQEGETFYNPAVFPIEE